MIVLPAKWARDHTLTLVDAAIVGKKYTNFHYGIRNNGILIL